MVVLAPWSSLTLPSGRAKPLVRGEGNPAALPPPQGSYQESKLLLVIGRSLLMRVHSSPRLEKILHPV